MYIGKLMRLVAALAIAWLPQILILRQQLLSCFVFVFHGPPALRPLGQHG